MLFLRAMKILLLAACVLMVVLGTSPQVLAQEIRKGQEAGGGSAETNPTGPTTGTIRGNAIEAETGETLIGAVILIEALKMGTATDLDGNYELRNVPPGQHTLTAKYLGFDSLKYTVTVQAGGIALQDFQLQPENIEVEAVVIASKTVRNNEAALLTQQRMSSVVLNGISADEISRSGDRDAASAVRRVAGVTIEDGRYLYVRGLGDRYSKVILNGAQIPSLDPERNSVQLDLFPTALLDNMVVIKSLRPDYTAEFSGGLLDVNLRDFPEKLTFTVSSSVGYNTQATFQDILLQQRTAKDAIGFGYGSRARPETLQRLLENGQTIPQLTFAPGQAREDINAITTEFGNQMQPTTYTAPVNHRHSISFGNQYAIGKRSLGVVAALTYRRDFQFYDDGETNGYDLASANDVRLNPRFELDDTRGQERVQWGGLATLALKLNERNKLRLTGFYAQAGESSGRFQVGPFPEDDPGLIYQNRTQAYTQRSLRVAQLGGEHLLGAKKARFNWLTSFAQSIQDEPDIRFFNNDFEIVNGDTVYDIDVSLYSRPVRMYREMDEINLDNRLDFSIPFNGWAGKSEFKVGVEELVKRRNFTENRYEYFISDDYDYNGQVEPFFTTDSTWYNPANGEWNLYMQDQTELDNIYSANQFVTAAYAMVDMPLAAKLRFSGGVRFERTDIVIETDAPPFPKGELRENDVLPSANFVYGITKDINLRASYGMSVSRPSFRELAPFSSFNFLGDYVLKGNPDLERTLGHNADLRFEWFPSPSEIISVSGFYKYFNDPIQREFNVEAQNPEIQFSNIDYARNVGLEFELRKNFGFLWAPLRFLQLNVNYTYVNSVTQIPEGELAVIRDLRPDAEDTRPMFGQSDHVLNAKLGYVNPETGTTAQVSFNVFSERLAVVGDKGTPDVYEQPRPSLDIVLIQRFAKRFNVSFRAQNLLNPEYLLEHHYKGEDYTFTKYTIGRSFSLGFGYAIN